MFFSTKRFINISSKVKLNLKKIHLIDHILNLLRLKVFINIYYTGYFKSTEDNISQDY